MSAGIPIRQSYDPAKRYKRLVWIEERDAQGWGLNEEQELLDQERSRLGGSIWREAGVLQGLTPAIGAGGQLTLTRGIAWLEGRAEPLEPVVLTFPTGTVTTPVTPASTTVVVAADAGMLGFPVAGVAYLVAPVTVPSAEGEMPESPVAGAFTYTGLSGGPGGTLQFTGVTGIASSWAAGSQVVRHPADTVFVRWTLDQVTMGEDPTLVEPYTGDPVEERLRATTAFTNESPDALDERFIEWDGGPNAAPRNWTRVSGAVGQGAPKFGEISLRLIHTNGTPTVITRQLSLAPNAIYSGYLWARVADGKTALTLSHGLNVKFLRTLPVWTPPGSAFEAPAKWKLHTFTITADANAQDVTFQIEIPAAAPTTEVLLDAILITTAPLTGLELERHHIPLLFWNRATDRVIKAQARASLIKMADLVPPLDAGTDAVRIPFNEEFLDYEAIGTFDEHGHYRVPPGMLVTRDARRDTATHLGINVSPGRARVRGYRARLSRVQEILIEKATTFITGPVEAKTFAFGQNLQILNKAAAPALFPVKSIGAVTGAVERTISATKGSAGGVDPLGVSVNLIESVGNGARGTHTGTQAGPYTFDELNNTLVIAVTTFAGTAGANQNFWFARGSYTRAEVLQALQYGSGPAYRAGKIVGNVLFEDAGTGIRISTQAYGTGHSVTIAGTAGSTANTPLGWTPGTYSASGVRYVLTTDYLVSGDAISWAPVGVEPGVGTTYYVTLRENKTFASPTDYVLGGRLAAGTYSYRIAAWGASGEGLPSVAVSRVTGAGEINHLTWSAVPNAISYHVYRAADGATFRFLKNTQDVFFDDEGTLTPDTTKAPQTLSTTLNGAVAAFATTITVVSTTGFPASGTAFIEGSDIFTYTGVTGTTFTGCALVSPHASGPTVRMGPDMGPVAVELGTLGVINWMPVGPLDPTDGSNYSVTYDYYQRRVDRVVIDRYSRLMIIKGIPADEPGPAPMPEDVLELAQVSAEAYSTTLTIINLTLYDRPLVSELRIMMERVETLYHNDIGQQVLNEIADKDSTTTRAKLGLVADGFSNLDYADTNHPDFAALVDQVLRNLTVSRDSTFPAYTVNTGLTSAVLVPKGTRWVLPSTEITLASQMQWSEPINVNPYAIFKPPTPRISVEPPWMNWVVDPNNNLNRWKRVAQEAVMVIAKFQGYFQSRPDISGSYRGVWDRYIATARSILARNLQVQATFGGEVMTLHEIPLRLDAYQYGPDEDNIAITFGGVPITNPTWLAPGSPGTLPGTIRADDLGQWAAWMTIPIGMAAGSHNIWGRGQVSDAVTVFTGLAQLVPPPPPGGWWTEPPPPEPPPPPRNWADPIAQAFVFEDPVTISGIQLYFTAKAESTRLFVQVRLLENGFPAPNPIYTQMISPVTGVIADPTGNTPTMIQFDEYLAFAAGQAFAITLLSESNDYFVACATLGKIGKNPVAYITANPYPNGLLFTSSNAQTWTPEQGRDLKFNLIGRTFTSPAVLEFNELSGVDYSDLCVLAEQITPAGTTISWEYELNGTNIIQKIEPYDFRRLSARSSLVKVRARLSSTIPRLSPVITAAGTYLMGSLNAQTGKYIRTLAEFTNPFTWVQVYSTMLLPPGTTVDWYVSKDNGTTWAGPLGIQSQRTVAEGWTEYTYTEFNFGSPGTQFRIRGDLGATADRLRIPLVMQVGASLRV